MLACLNSDIARKSSFLKESKSLDRLFFFQYLLLRFCPVKDFLTELPYGFEHREARPPLILPLDSCSGKP